MAIRTPEMSDDDYDRIQRIELTEFFELIGIIITTWSGIESKLFRISHAVLRTNRNLASIVFFRTPTLSGRIQLTHELVEAAFPKPDREGAHDHPLLVQWRKVHRKFERFLALRNLLAHHQFSSMGLGAESWPQIHYKVNESWRGRKKPDVDVLKLEDLRAHLVDLRTFFNNVTNCMHAIFEELGKPPR